MPKYKVKICGECGLLKLEEEIEFEADNDEQAEEEGADHAQTAFENWASYGFTVTPAS